MKSGELVILERMARNFPVKRIFMGRVEGDYGVVYLAWGRDMTGVYHGIWGHMGVARTLQSTKGAKLKMFKEIMLRDAEGFIDELRKVRMIKEGMFHAGHA